MGRRPRVDSDTGAQALDVAERLVQVRGFNGFSYADVASVLKVTKAALHYHFAGKAELGQALIARYAARFMAALAGIDANVDVAPAKLDGYAGLYRDALRDQRMCLCGMLAADYHTLPTSMQDAVLRFFDDNEAWLTQVLERGRAEGSLQFAGTAGEVARMILSGLEGAMLVARSYGDLSRFDAVARRLLSGLVAAGRPADVSGRDEDPC